jgi:hypothetical protein
MSSVHVTKRFFTNILDRFQLNLALKTCTKSWQVDLILFHVDSI